ncbi:MAG: hypothetical protein RLZZ385_918 [Pseudomonadota bacterium]|jgi:hypothetical protein
MIFRLLAILALVLLVFWAINSVSRRFALSRSQAQMLVLLGALLTTIVVLIGLGRLPVHFILAPLGVAATFLLRMLPTVLRLLPLWSMLRSKLHHHRATAGPSAGQTSTLRTAFLAMELAHASGDLDGKVLKGSFAGQRLSSLSLSQLLELLREIQADGDSQRILEAYLDRMHGGWRDTQQGQRDSAARADESAMSRELAMEILGLAEPLEREQVVQAHRRLMQKMHPDRGGSDYLAKKINAARDFLLESL